MIQNLEKAISNLKSLSLPRLLFNANSQPSAMDGIEISIRLRLNNSGTTASGVKLRTDTAISQGRPAYSIRTTQLTGKSSFVNLNDGGEFHDSINAKALSNGDIQIIGNFWKSNFDGVSHIGDNFNNQFPSETGFENEITDLNKIELTAYVNKYIKPYFKQELKKAFNV